MLSLLGTWSHSFQGFQRFQGFQGFATKHPVELEVVVLLIDQTTFGSGLQALKLIDQLVFTEWSLLARQCQFRKASWVIVGWDSWVGYSWILSEYTQLLPNYYPTIYSKMSAAMANICKYQSTISRSLQNSPGSTPGRWHFFVGHWMNLQLLSWKVAAKFIPEGCSESKVSTIFYNPKRFQNLPKSTWRSWKHGACS